MTPKEFQGLLSKTQLSHKEHDAAWRLYKSEGPRSAEAYVLSTNETINQIQGNVILRQLPAPYQVWGREHIEQGAINQMINAAKLPVSIAGSLMPDAHQGYGLPIGGVLATDNAVIPYAVGVDIACRMMLTVYPISAEDLRQPESQEFLHLKEALLQNTIFGSGPDGMHEGNIEHPILDEANWQSTKLTRSLRLTAIHQIGTSGTGNHFVEWGELEVIESNNPLDLAPGNYLALLSHSGSRGVGYKIADHYTKLAMDLLSNLDPQVKHLAWLSLEREAGVEYWQAMHLAGDFASACHHVIHEQVAKAAGLRSIASVENHHNFAWREKIVVDGREVEAIVHRKGATPAGKGVLGVIPGTMADLGFVVVGKGCDEALNSASHGSGRQMTRTSAMKNISVEQHQAYLKTHGVTLIGGGLDEAPQAYKSIIKVIEAQQSLVDVIGKFQPRIVRMADDKQFASSKSLPKGLVDALGE